MNHSPRKCKICGEYHCLAGCVPVEQCRKAVEKAEAEEEVSSQDIKNRLEWALDS